MAPPTPSKPSKPRLTWRKQPKERGFGHGPRGFSLFLDGERVGTVSAIGGGAPHHGPFVGWMWSCPTSKQHGIEWKNTAAEKRQPIADVKDAKAECRAYVEACLAKKTPNHAATGAETIVREERQRIARLMAGIFENHGSHGSSRDDIADLINLAGALAEGKAEP